LADVSDALTKSNRNVGGGFLQHGDQQMAIRAVGYVRSPQDVQAIVLKSEGGTPVTIGDISRVVLSHTPRLGAVGYNVDGEVAEGFALLRRGENPSVVLDGIHEKVRQLNESILPKGMRIRPFYDRTDLVSETLGTVHHNLLFGALLVIAIVWLFLRSMVFVDRGVDHPARAADGVHRTSVDSPASQSHLDGRGRFRHPGGWRGGARRKRPARGASPKAETPPGAPAAHHSFRGRRGAPDVLRDGHHHRGAHSGVHAAAGRGPHLSAAGADL
jgi:hypothetical protein